MLPGILREILFTKRKKRSQDWQPWRGQWSKMRLRKPRSLNGWRLSVRNGPLFGPGSKRWSQLKIRWLCVIGFYYSRDSSQFFFPFHVAWMACVAPIIQAIYLTFERLWHLARETFAPIWCLSKLSISTNSVIKSFQKIWSENTQKRRPRGSSIKHDEIWPAKFGQMCLAQIFEVYLLHLSEL